MTRRTDVSIPTEDGQCPAALVTPDGDGPWPAVIVFQDAPGMRPAVVAIGEQLADLGYVALVPEMYYRSGPYEPFDTATAFGDPDQRARLGALMGSTSKTKAAQDTGAFLDFLAERPEVADAKVGTTGYCMGGGFALVAAATYPDRIGAAASFHGGQLASDAEDSPHRIAGQISGTVYVGAAQDDASFPEEQATRLAEVLTEAGVPHTIETYAAAHGFAVSDMPTYDAAAAARHMRALEHLYAATLR